MDYSKRILDLSSTQLIGLIRLMRWSADLKPKRKSPRRRIARGPQPIVCIKCSSAGRWTMHNLEHRSSCTAQNLCCGASKPPLREPACVRVVYTRAQAQLKISHIRKGEGGSRQRSRLWFGLYAWPVTRPALPDSSTVVSKAGLPPRTPTKRNWSLLDLPKVLTHLSCCGSARTRKYVNEEKVFEKDFRFREARSKARRGASP